MQEAELEFAHLSQERSYWCGPAAVRMALSARLGAATPAQHELASDEHLRTEALRETPDRHVIRAVLNRYLHVDRYAVCNVSHPYTAVDRRMFLRALVDNIGSGWPIVATLWVRPDDPRPPGYPAPTGEGIKHIVAIRGFARAGAVIRLADPASNGTGVRWGAGVPPVYDLRLEDMMTLMGGKGYVA